MQKQESKTVIGLAEAIHLGKLERVKSNPIKLQARSPESNDSCIIASRKISNGDIILSVSFDDVVSSNQIKNSHLGNKLRSILGNGCNQDYYLYLFVLQEKNNVDSKWQLCFQSQDRNYPHLPIQFSLPQLERLRGSSVVEAIVEKRYWLEQGYKRLLSHLEFANYSFDQVLWAFNLVQRFQIRLDGDSLILPVSSLIRRSTSANTSWRLNQKKGSVELVAIKTVYPEEQLTYAYCEENTHDIFLTHGVVEDFATYGKTRVTLSLESSDPILEIKKTFLGIDSSSQHFYLGPGSPQGFTKALQFLRVKYSLQIDCNIPNFEINPCVEIESKVLKAFSSACKRALIPFNSSNSKYNNEDRSNNSKQKVSAESNDDNPHWQLFCYYEIELLEEYIRVAKRGLNIIDLHLESETKLIDGYPLDINTRCLESRNLDGQNLEYQYLQHLLLVCKTISLNHV